MIRLRGIEKSYQMGTRALHVLRALDLSIDEGEALAIMGPSGSGKSTLMHVLGVLDAYDAGTYHLDGRLIRALSENEAAAIRNRTIGFVFQAFHLLPFKNAVENVALPLYYQGVARARRNAIALEHLERVGLADWRDHLPSELSGGQKQRLAIARALITQPRLLLADEPTGALDSETSREIMDLLLQVNAQGITLVIVTHEPGVAARTRRIVRLRDGVVESDLPNPGPLA